MPKEDVSELLRSIQYIEAPPATVRQWVQKANDLIARISSHAFKNQRKQEMEELSRIAERIHELPVLTSGKNLLFRDLVGRLKNEFAKQTRADLAPGNCYEMSPFKELGAVRIQPSAAATDSDISKVRNLFYAAEGQALGARVRVPSPSARNPLVSAETIYLKVSWSWWTVWPVYEHFEATASVTATGWDAADIAGGQYALAKQLCETLDPQGNALLGLLKLAACNYANNTPEVPFPVQELKVTVCTCWARAASVDCFHYDDKDACSAHDVLGTAGPVKATTSIWGGPDCLFDEQMAVEVRLTFNGGGLYLYQSTPGCLNY